MAREVSAQEFEKMRSLKKARQAAAKGNGSDHRDARVRLDEARADRSRRGKTNAGHLAVPVAQPGFGGK